MGRSFEQHIVNEDRPNAKVSGGHKPSFPHSVPVTDPPIGIMSTGFTGLYCTRKLR